MNSPDPRASPEQGSAGESGGPAAGDAMELPPEPASRPLYVNRRALRRIWNGAALTSALFLLLTALVSYMVGNIPLVGIILLFFGVFFSGVVAFASGVNLLVLWLFYQSETPGEMDGWVFGLVEWCVVLGVLAITVWLMSR